MSGTTLRMAGACGQCDQHATCLYPDCTQIAASCVTHIDGDPIRTDRINEQFKHAIAGPQMTNEKFKPIGWNTAEKAQAMIDKIAAMSPVELADQLEKELRSKGTDLHLWPEAAERIIALLRAAPVQSVALPWSSAIGKTESLGTLPEPHVSFEAAQAALDFLMGCVRESMGIATFGPRKTLELFLQQAPAPYGAPVPTPTERELFETICKAGDKYAPHWLRRDPKDKERYALGATEASFRTFRELLEATISPATAASFATIEGLLAKYHEAVWDAAQSDHPEYDLAGVEIAKELLTAIYALAVIDDVDRSNATVPGVTESLAETMVENFRKAHPGIAVFWSGELRKVQNPQHPQKDGDEQRRRFETIYAVEGTKVNEPVPDFTLLASGVYADMKIRVAYYWFNRKEDTDPWDAGFLKRKLK